MKSDYEIFSYSVLIMEKHLDSFGHVNNAAYLELYEEARWDFITKHGFGLERIKKEKKGPVVLEANLKFKKELLNREVITILSTSRNIIRDKIMTLEQQMIKADGSIASELLLTVGFFDLSSRQLIPPEEGWLKAVGFKVI
jgi:YbgC/YbaW family acyl-CoA thioester hydrolase